MRVRLLCLLVLMAAPACSGEAADVGAQATADAGAGTWCCYEDEAHTVTSCGLPEGRHGDFCWDDAIPAHPGDD
jgi:hypothetical protein